MRSCVLLLAGSLLAGAARAGEMRLWANREGTRHLEAELIEVVDQRAVLKRPGGDVVRIPLDSLSATDRNYIARVMSPDNTDQSAKPRPPKHAKRKLVGVVAIRKALDRRLKLSYKDVPLFELLADLEQQMGVEMIVDGNSLAEAGIALDEQVSMSTAGWTVGEALQTTLNKVGVAWTVRHEVLMIVAKKEDRSLTTVVYKVIRPLDTRTLERDIIRTVAVTRWIETGGKGRIARLRGVFVVAQSSEVHTLLAEKYKGVLQPLVLEESGATKPALRGLRQRTELEFTETPLSQVLKALEKKHGLTFELDHIALAQKGIEEDSQVTIQVSGVMVSSALSIILDSLKLVWQVDKGKVRITTAGDNMAEEDLVTQSYHIGRLRSLADRKELVDVFEDLVARRTWKEHGGQGEVRRSRVARDVIVVTQTRGVHADIARVLAEMLLALN